jgi:APA family basic amino acid/polyamine antiporter
MVPILGIIFNGYMMYKLGWVNWARLIIWLVIGMVIYFTYSVKNSRLQRGELVVPEEPTAPSYAD